MHDFETLLLYVALFIASLGIGFYLSFNARRLLLFIKPELLRRNVVTFFIGLCFFISIGHLMPDFRNILTDYGWGRGFLLFCIIVVCNVLLPYNIVLFITEGRRFVNIDFIKQQAMIFFSIVVPSVVVNGAINYWINGSAKNLKYSVVWSFYMGALGAVVYLFVRHYDAEKKKKLF
ncbi:MAG TPA: hypothetical protein VM871_05555, partial [Flavisolibacter sp.]|nr:hypothetical protein [Flavisolibacter sp.]